MLSVNTSVKPVFFITHCNDGIASSCSGDYTRRTIRTKYKRAASFAQRHEVSGYFSGDDEPIVVLYRPVICSRFPLAVSSGAG